MFIKQISAATLAAAIIAGSAAVARAESNVSGVDGGLTSESSLQRDTGFYRGSYAYAIPRTATGVNAYGYAGGGRHLRSHTRAHPKMKHRN